MLTLHQKEGGSLKEFMIWFNTEKLKVEDPDEGVIFSAIYNGISSNEPMAWKIERRQLENLQELLDKVEEFINEEETLKAMKLTQKAPKKPGEKKKKDQPKLANPTSSQKRFSDYNFTPLNANISEVLMERFGVPKASKDTMTLRSLGKSIN